MDINDTSKITLYRDQFFDIKFNWFITGFMVGFGISAFTILMFI